MEVVLGILFLALSNINIQFAEKELIWKSYTTVKAVQTTKWIELINKKEFVEVALDENFKTFLIYMASLNVAPSIHLDRVAQIAFFLAKEVKIPDQYSDFVDVFSEEKVLVLPKWIESNQHSIELKEGKQPLYWPIYSLGPLELKTLKTYIKTHLKTGFIQLSKSPVGTPILFNEKPDSSFCLCVDYQALNNLTIKNQYFYPSSVNHWTA